MSQNWAFGGEPALVGASGVATVVAGSTFCISSAEGDILPGAAQGLFFRDMRCLSRWELRVDGRNLQPLALIQPTPSATEHICRVPPLPGRPESTLLVVRRRRLEAALAEDVTIRNLGQETAGCSVTLLVDADFADLFEVKENRVVSQPDRVTVGLDHAGMAFEYRWMGHARGVHVSCDARVALSPRLLTMAAVIPPRGEWEVHLAVRPTDGAAPAAVGDEEPRQAVQPRPSDAAPAFRVRTPSARWRRALESGVRDLTALRMADPQQPDQAILAAGAPWFMALFGRDALLASWMALPVDPGLALGTLQTLARLQGREVSPLTEEEPGRILHEVRLGVQSALALGGEAVYYGSVDATPLFVMLVDELRRWGLPAGELDALLPHVDRALDWIVDYGDRDGDGFVEYKRATSSGLANQGWKDSWDGVTSAAGRVAEPPVALCEVQAYVYGAFVARAAIAADAGDTATARRWTTQAERLRARFDEVFWLPGKGHYALALDGAKHPVDALASNVGHCLWTGIAEPHRAAALVEHLLGEQLFSGWGIRTLATSAAAYNPVSYHNGSVWPHDNAIIAAGLARYGYVDEARRVTSAMLDAADAFGGRLPELWCGFDRGEFPVPVPYPTSCSPQAWASAAPLLLLRALLRLEPAVPAGAVRMAPALPEDLPAIVLDGVRIAGSSVRLEVDAAGARATGLPSGIELVTG